MRIKALQQTIDTQSARITDLISSQVLASVDGMGQVNHTKNAKCRHFKKILEIHYLSVN